MIIRLLFFDMEFANGQVLGSVYSFGYLVTDEQFRILIPPTDLCINPECKWNEYVEKNILAYPKEEIECAPAFPECFEQIRTLFAESDVAVGFAVSNDIKALRQDCERYGKEPFSYRWFDVEQLCRMQEMHSDAHGLGRCFQAWCGGAEPEHRHRSDGDADATMRVMKAICEAHHVTADMLLQAYPECCGEAVPTTGGVAVCQSAKASSKKKKRHWYHRKNKKEREAIP